MLQCLHLQPFSRSFFFVRQRQVLRSNRKHQQQKQKKNKKKTKKKKKNKKKQKKKNIIQAVLPKQNFLANLVRKYQKADALFRVWIILSEPGCLAMRSRVESRREKNRSFPVFPKRFDTNLAVQAQKMNKAWKF